jgi:integrase
VHRLPDFRTATLHVRRVKQGTPSTRDELRALRRLQREQEPKSPFVFTSERGAPFTTAGFARMIERAGGEPSYHLKHTLTCYVMRAGTRLQTGAHEAHPHMLRHACGYALANRGPRHEGAASIPGS